MHLRLPPLVVAGLLVAQLPTWAVAELPNRIATVTVAAADSDDRQRANLVADGRDDAVELRAAMARLGKLGGTVRLLPGHYRLDNAGSLVDVPSNTTLDGGGHAVLECLVTGQQGPLRFSDAHDVVIRGVRFVSSNDKQAAMFAMMNVGTGKSRDITIRDCRFSGFSSYALRMNMPGTRFRFIHNHLQNMGRVGKGGSAINGARMIDSLIGWNTVEGCGVDAGDWGIYISGGGARNLQVVGIRHGRSIALGGCRDVLVTGNMITMGNGAAGIGTETAIHHVTISNNIVDMNGLGRQGQSGIAIASDDSSFVSITGNQVFGGHPTSICLHVSTLQHGVISGNLLRVSKGTVNGGTFGGCGIRIGRVASPDAWHLLVSGNRIHSPITRNVGIQLVAGGIGSIKSHVQLVNNTFDGFQFAIALDRQSGGRYRDVVIRGNTSTRSPLVGKHSSADTRIVIQHNTEPALSPTKTDR